MMMEILAVKMGLVLLLGVGLHFPSFDQKGIGLGTREVHPSAALEIQSSSQGILFPRIQLLSAIDDRTIPKPATGLVIYHIGMQNPRMDPGIYVNVGTPEKPSWILGGESVVDENIGTRTYKVKYLGRNMFPNTNPKPTLKIDELNLEVRFAVVNNLHRFQVRLLNRPNRLVTISGAGTWVGYNNGAHNNLEFNFTPSNYNQWQNIRGNWNAFYNYQYYFISNEFANLKNACIIYGICSYGINNAAEEQYFLAGEVF